MTVPCNTIRPPLTQTKLVRPFGAVRRWIFTSIPGSTGAMNLALTSVVPGKQASTSSSSTTPGTMGRPGK